MDAINMAVLAELQEYAQLYFSAIVGLHTVDGRCGLKPGKYTAKELADSNKAACGLYVLPQDPIFDEQITITAGTFNCEFPYRRIFAILAQWEAMSKAGKQKAVFEIGEVEEKSAKVLLNEISESGTFKEKRVKLQRITGNWWIPRKVKKNQPIELYYELNGVMLVPGKQVWSDSPTDPQTVKWCEQHNDEEVSKLLLSFISNDREGTQQNTLYYAEVVNRANIAATPAETPRIVRVEIVRDFDKSYYANLYGENGGCHNLSKEYTDFRTLKTLCKKEYGVNLPNLSQIEFETHGRKSYAYISTETPRISTETAETVNISAEGENAAERANIEQNHSDTRIVEDEYRHKYKVTRHWLNGRIESIEVWDLDHTSEPPQSPTTSTDIQTIKPQENRVQAARKEPKRTIQIFLIVQRPQSVVRNLRTSPSYHFADVRKMVVPRLVRNVPRGCFTAVMPHGSPPIRGDCAIINFLTKQSTRYG